MITLDKSLQNQRIICTISEIEMGVGNVPILKVENKLSNLNYSLNLPENTSNFITRFDEFIFSTSEISSWSEGKYLYIIWEFNPSTQQTIQELEIGLLQIIDTTADKSNTEFIEVPSKETDDDFVVYEGNN